MLPSPRGCDIDGYNLHMHAATQTRLSAHMFATALRFMKAFAFFGIIYKKNHIWVRVYSKSQK